MIKENKEWGFSATEFLTVVVLAMLIMIIVLSFAISRANEQKFQVFKYDAMIFSMNAANYDMKDHINTLYLTTLIDKKIMEPIKNPFMKDKYCNKDESKVEFTENTRLITLKCGDYLIKKQNVQEDNYIFYKVGPWKNKPIKPSKKYTIEETKLYNYTIDEKQILEYYVEKDLLVTLFNERNNTFYQTFEEIDKITNIIDKTYYRTSTIIKLKDKS